jgi:hypothetical protein
MCREIENMIGEGRKGVVVSVANFFREIIIINY